MTDRSSEERSRFEKWWHQMETGSWDRRELSWFAWRAALEDRQEAAPEVTRCENCEAEIFFDTSSDEWYHTERPRTTPSCGNPMPGVPSEATPSKENEMVGSTGRIHKKTHDCETAGCRPAPAPEVPIAPSKENAPPRHAMSQGMEFWESAPAPEVQGTPTKNPWFCKICGVSSGPCEHWDAHEIARVTGAPVGTPQKETPTMPYGAGAQNFGAVPEGVQGKEPPQRAPLNSEIELHNAYVSGEAAGRRSAITVLQARIKAYCYGNFNAKIALSWCAELLEKTK